MGARRVRRKVRRMKFGLFASSKLRYLYDFHLVLYIQHL